MSSLMDLLGQQVLGRHTGDISRQLGKDEGSVSTAIGAALPLIMGALSKNSQDDKGAESLAHALNKDHDGSILDDIGGFLGKADNGPGEGILGHVFGSRRQRVESSVGKVSGMDTASVSKLMVMLAPMVMGMLGKKQREQKMDARSLAGMLGDERSTMQTKMPEMGLLNSVLDSDNDGDVDLGDLLKGAGTLEKLFGKN